MAPQHWITMPYYNRNLFEFLNDEEEEEGEIVEEVIMTMWGPAIGKLNWAEEMEREENKKLKYYKVLRNMT